MHRTLTGLAVTVTALPGAALAHAAYDHGGGLMAGLAHPVLGPDHLLAMLAVGLCAALAGGRALLAWPAAFVAAMLAGGLIGAGGAPLPVVEPAIQASVVVIGAVAALALRVPMPVALAGLAAFGLAHGHAHGVEGPGGAAYAAGFLIATVALHAAGIALALLAARAGRSTLARGAGGAAALAGLSLAFG